MYNDIIYFPVVIFTVFVDKTSRHNRKCKNTQTQYGCATVTDALPAASPGDSGLADYK